MATPSRQDVRQLPHVPALDGLRGVAVLLVVLCHTPLLVHPGLDKVTTAPGFGWLNTVARGGFLGVDIFFVLSGFLITSLLLGHVARTGTIGFRRFYRRRAFRLLPALIALLAVHFVYSCFATYPAFGAFPVRHAIPMRQELNTIGAALAYISNYVVAMHPNSIAAADLGHLWSLSVEEQFYLVWPVVLALVIRWRTDMVPRVIYAGIFLVVGNRLLLSTNPRLDLYVRTDTRADALLIGALLAWAWTHGEIPKLPSAAPWCATAVIIVFVATSTNASAILFNGGFTLFAGAVAILVLAIVDTGWGTALRTRPLRAAGRLSYGLYLWHVPIFVAIARANLPRDPTARVACGYALTALATTLSWILVEKPALARRTPRTPTQIAAPQPRTLSGDYV